MRKGGGSEGGVVCVFFFKQKTAYEMLRSLVGSEMCIRDRYSAENRSSAPAGDRTATKVEVTKLIFLGTA